jgi:hypothetical protein
MTPTPMCVRPWPSTRLSLHGPSSLTTRMPPQGAPSDPSTLSPPATTFEGKYSQFPTPF